MDLHAQSSVMLLSQKKTQSENQTELNQTRRRRFRLALLLLAVSLLGCVVGNMWALWIVHKLWEIPPNSNIWPMGMTIALFFIVILTTGFAVSAPVACIIHRSKSILVLTIIAIAFGILIWYLPFRYVRYIAKCNHLTFGS
jgi:Ca2+/Na+ antiporter